MPAPSPGLASLCAPLPSAFFLTFSQNSGLRIVGTHLGSKPLASSAVGIARTHDNFRPSLHVWRGPLPFAQEILGSPGFLLGPSAPIHLPAPLPPAQGTLSESPWRSSTCGEQCLGASPGAAWPGKQEGLPQLRHKDSSKHNSHPLRQLGLPLPFPSPMLPFSDLFAQIFTLHSPHRMSPTGQREQVAQAPRRKELPLPKVGQGFLSQ